MLTHQYNQDRADILRKISESTTLLAERINQLQLRVEELEANQALDRNQIKQLKTKLDKVYP